jgi:predicted metalloprotease
MGGTLLAGGGIGGVILTVLYLLLGGDPADIQQQPQSPRASTSQGAPGNDAGADFVGKVLADTEDVWRKELPAQAGRPYVDPKLVLFTNMTQSGCGYAQSATGPFYCPEDQSVYIDLGFYQQMKERFGAGGDFAQAYVIAHEVGHHVQHQLRISDQVHNAQERSDRTEGNQLSVRLELQADCLAGVWANHAQEMKQILEPGDVEEALNAASAIGDDRLTKGRVSPDSFTHGTSEQRSRWFRTGFQTGKMSSCDTFNGNI